MLSYIPQYHSFLWLNNSPLCGHGYAVSRSSTRPLTDTWFVCLQLLALVDSDALNVCKHLVSPCSQSSMYTPRSKIWGHMIIPCSTFPETAKVLSPAHFFFFCRSESTCHGVDDTIHIYLMSRHVIVTLAFY